MNQQIRADFKLQLDAFQLDVELALPGRGVTVFYGASGSGKTSLLRCIAGLERADSGYLRVNGEVWQDSERGFWLPTHKRPLGYVFQEASLFPHLSVNANLQYGRKRSAQVRKPVALEQAIELLGIGHLLERKPDRLSGGERQRVAIARALAVCPRVLLMDEPLAALDPERKQEILPFLQRLQRELDIPILYITHSPQEVTRLADYLVVLEQGRVIAAGELQDTLTRLDSPLALGQRASSVLTATVCAYEHEFQLMHMRFSGGELSVPSAPLPLGTAVRLRIYARDVSVLRESPPSVSGMNLLPAVIVGRVDDEQGYTVLRLAVGEVSLLAQITRKSAVLLELTEGMRVVVQVKGASILG